MAVIDERLAEKQASLEGILKEMGSVLVAYSGGVDSTFLAVVAHDVLGERSLAVTASSPSVAPQEIEEAVALAKELGLHHRVIETHELSNPDYVANSPQRCFFCKVELYTRLHPIATEEMIYWVASGANVDDMEDYRPGLEAGKMYKIRNPLVEAGLTKEDVRSLSRQRGLPTWDKPAQPCLSSRIPYGTPVSVETLDTIAHAESLLRELGIRQGRVRHHATIARIEVDPSDMDMLLSSEVREKLVADLRTLGYLYVTLDMAGFRSGSLNAALGSDVGRSQG